MANYDEFVRSNYVKVTDVAAWSDLCDMFDVESIEDDGRCGFLAEEFQETILIERDHAADEERNFFDEAEDLLCDGEVLIVMGSGREADRYVAGWAYACNNHHESRLVKLSAIYDLAEELGTDFTFAEY